MKTSVYTNINHLINSSNGNETTYGNPDITWEKVNMLNVGADIRILKDINITFDYYDKLTTDLIITPLFHMLVVLKKYQ